MRLLATSTESATRSSGTPGLFFAKRSRAPELERRAVLLNRECKTHGVCRCSGARGARDGRGGSAGGATTTVATFSAAASGNGNENGKNSQGQGQIRSRLSCAQADEQNAD